MQLRVLSYNIHKGFTSGNWSFVLDGIKTSIEKVHADLVFLVILYVLAGSEGVNSDGTRRESHVFPKTGRYIFPVLGVERLVQGVHAAIRANENNIEFEKASAAVEETTFERSVQIPLVKITF